MRNAFIVFILALLSVFAIPAHSQQKGEEPTTSSAVEGQTSVEVPAAEVAEQTKPFLGTWDAVSCQSNPISIRFSIAPGDEDDPRPQFTLLQIFEPNSEPALMELSATWRTHDFTEIQNVVGQDGKTRTVIYLEVTNGSIMLTLVPAIKNTLFGTALLASQPNAQLVVVVGKSTGKLADFYAKTVGVCTDEPAFDRFFGLPVDPAKDEHVASK